jgi:hypothetical protein
VTVLATNFLCKLINWAGFWPLLAALLTAVATLFSAWLGGRIAGKHALRAQEQAARDQRERDRQIERQASMGILRAIEAELTVHKDALEPLLGLLKKTPAGMPLATMPIDQNFFIVYEANAAALGMIDNPDLLAEIVRVYGQAKGLEDALNFNHQRCVLWDNLRDNLAEPESVQDGKNTLQRQRLDNLTSELVAIKGKIDRDLQTLLFDLDQLLGNLRAYLASQKNAG